MILRAWLTLGTLIVVAAWLLTVPLSPPPRQASTGTSADAYRAEGLLPQVDELRLSEELGHEIFEVPKTDAEHLATAAAAGGGEMPDMDMGGQGDMPSMTAPMPAEPEGAASATPATEMEHGGAMQPTSPSGSEVAGGKPGAMPGMASTEEAGHGSAEPPHTEMEMGQQIPAPPASMPGMAAEEHEAMPGMATEEHGSMPGMAMGPGEGEEGHMGGHGLAVVPPGMAGMATRTVAVEMKEWGFTPPRVEVTPGEVIHFVVHNAGKLPHEFMFMPSVAMQALVYRLQRADWNLTEHEAIFEQAIVMPGDSLEVTLNVMEPGSWMFMCMFPYHMQFGMMGMMMSEGAAMPGMDMSDMKM